MTLARGTPTTPLSTASVNYTGRARLKRGTVRPHSGARRATSSPLRPDSTPVVRPAFQNRTPAYLLRGPFTTSPFVIYAVCQFKSNEANSARKRVVDRLEFGQKYVWTSHFDPILYRFGRTMLQEDMPGSFRNQQPRRPALLLVI